MPITGDLPESGLRIVLERAGSGEGSERPPWVYRGDVALPEGRFHLQATVQEDGSVAVTAAPGAPEGTGARVHQLLRTLVKRAAADGEAPPRRIARWRP